MKLLSSVSLALVVAAGLGGVVRADAPAAKPAPSKPAPTKPDPAPAKPAPPPTADTPAAGDVARFLAFFDKMVDLIVLDKDDCAKMATDVNKHLDDNKELLDMAAAAQAKGQKLPDAARDHLTESSKKMLAALQPKCMKDKGVQAAIQRLPRPKRASK